MNRTLLLILCDFLLLTLLALTRWETAEPARPVESATVATEENSVVTPASDIVDLMKLSFEDEQARQRELAADFQAQQDELAARLEATNEGLAQRETVVSALEAERQQLQQERSRLETEQKELSATLNATVVTAARDATRLRQQVVLVKSEAEASRARMEQLQQDLEQREAEATQREEALEKIAAEKDEAERQVQDLSVAVKVAEQEKVLLRETAETYREQAENERIERIKVQETTVQLAEGVGQLAEKSAELTEDIRANRPINANTLFSDFMINRVPTSFTATRDGLLGESDRIAEAKTVLVSDGTTTYAVIHLEDTPFRIYEPAAPWTRLTVSLAKNGARFAAPEISFLQRDPRIVVIPVSPFEIASLGVKVYQMAADPFRFPEAVLISNGGQGYGELPFKLDAALPGYVRMDNRLMRRLFGDFSPSRGDLVLSKTGELLGVMVNSDFCAMVDSFLPMGTLKTGDLNGQEVERLLQKIQEQVGRGQSRATGRR